MKRDSYPPLLIAYIRKGRFRVEYRGEFNVAEAGDILLLDCIEPHYYHAEDGLEFVYMHFEGSTRVSCAAASPTGTAGSSAAITTR